MSDHADIIRQATDVLYSADAGSNEAIAAHNRLLAALDALEAERDEARLQWPASVKHFRQRAEAAENELAQMRDARQELVDECVYTKQRVAELETAARRKEAQ